MSICTGCHNGHISASCPEHGHLKEEHDKASKEYTAKAIACSALKRAAYSLRVHGAKEVAAQCEDALRALDNI